MDCVKAEIRVPYSEVDLQLPHVPVLNAPNTTTADKKQETEKARSREKKQACKLGIPYLSRREHRITSRTLAWAWAWAYW